MSKPKMNFAKLKQQRKTDSQKLLEMQQRIFDLESKLANTDAAAAERVKLALAEQKAHHDEDWRHAEEHHDVVKTTLERALADLADAQSKLVLREADIDALRVSLGHSNQMLEMERARIAEMQPQLDLIAQQRSDLERILDGVRDRMKRREAEDERAILNRKIIASAKPEFNRR